MFVFIRNKSPESLWRRGSHVLICSGTQLPNLIKQTDIWVQRKVQADGYSGDKKPWACNIFFFFFASIAGRAVQTGCVYLFLTAVCNLFHFKLAILSPYDFKVAERWLSFFNTAASDRSVLSAAPPTPRPPPIIIRPTFWLVKPSWGQTCPADTTYTCFISLAVLAYLNCKLECVYVCVCVGASAPAAFAKLTREPEFCQTGPSRPLMEDLINTSDDKSARYTPRQTE